MPSPGVWRHVDRRADAINARRVTSRESLAVEPQKLWVGVDENGLGPRLGPLVATACTLSVRELDVAKARALGARLGIEDSKVSSGFGSMAHAEGLALAIAEAALGRPPLNADDVLAALSLDGIPALRAPCPSSTQAQCWGELSVPAFGGKLALGRDLLRALGASKTEARVVRVRTAVLCAKTYNEALVRLSSKLVVDLELFERLVLDARQAAGADVIATCGMVGGIRKYPSRFQHFDPSKTAMLEEVKGRSAYRIEGVGEVSFEVDADAHALPVAIASMVGKYIRELLMARLNQFYRGHDATLTNVSGYHDPVTGRFVEATRLLREKLAIAPICFERNG